MVQRKKNERSKTALPLKKGTAKSKEVKEQSTSDVEYAFNRQFETKECVVLLSIFYTPN